MSQSEDLRHMKHLQKVVDCIQLLGKFIKHVNSQGDTYYSPMILEPLWSSDPSEVTQGSEEELQYLAMQVNALPHLNVKYHYTKGFLTKLTISEVPFDAKKDRL
ncbi:gp49 [Listeria phage P35]|uniref:Uncharacterized protein n=1 Tax=Listeria phage LP-083-1 TaxID=1458854 RepID=A0A059T6I3_9CAUD|nr:gp49 [Listeria phage P35]AAY53234.1 gp49 [Listeria phage P35]AHL19014.1 hypothetical protein LP083-1_049 [Listeria phage LP-083-1]